MGLFGKQILWDNQCCTLLINKYFISLANRFINDLNCPILIVVIPDAYFQLYQSIFEKDLLQETEDFYRNEAQQFLEYCNPSQYMHKVRQNQFLTKYI